MGSNSDWVNDLAQDLEAEEGDHGNGDPSAELFKDKTADLPEDIRAVWGNDPNAPFFIQAWGLEAFRESKLHKMAVLEHQRQQELAPLRSAYVKNGAKKK